MSKNRRHVDIREEYFVRHGLALVSEQKEIWY